LLGGLSAILGANPAQREASEGRWEYAALTASSSFLRHDTELLTFAALINDAWA